MHLHCYVCRLFSVSLSQCRDGHSSDEGTARAEQKNNKTVVDNFCHIRTNVANKKISIWIDINILSQFNFILTLHAIFYEL